MSNIVDFKKKTTKKQKHEMSIDEYTEDLSLQFKKMTESVSKKDLILNIKGILRSRGVKFRASPPNDLKIKKGHAAIYFPSIRVAFAFEVIKDLDNPSNWVLVKLSLQDNAADSAGKIINKIESKANVQS